MIKDLIKPYKLYRRVKSYLECVGGSVNSLITYDPQSWWADTENLSSVSGDALTETLFSRSPGKGSRLSSENSEVNLLVDTGARSEKIMRGRSWRQTVMRGTMDRGRRRSRKEKWT